jgi:hypothetical protein
MKKDIKIYFAGAWGYSSRQLTDIFKRQTPNNKGQWDTIMSIDNKEEADFIIVQDQTDEKNIDRSKVIFFGREPRHIQYLFWDNCYKSFHHANNTSWLTQTWWVNIPFNDLINPTPPIKTKNLSVIDSGKRMTGSHRQRVNIINGLINKYPNHIDVYGKICTGRPIGNVYKGGLPDRSKEMGLLDYRYTLSIENGKANNYFSEKIIDPLLCWNMPIYWGCPNINKFLPAGSYVNIDINDPFVVDKIKEISQSNLREENMDKIREARELIINKYNIWPTIKSSLMVDNLLNE